MIAPWTMLQAALERVHDASGAPWWATIVVSTVALRCATTIPLVVSGLRNSARMELDVRPYAQAWQVKTVQRLVREHPTWSLAEIDKTAAKEMRALIPSLAKQHGVPPLMHRIALPLVQIPIWVTYSLALRQMCASPILGFDTATAPVDGLATGGLFWLSDLTVADPLVLPVAVASVHLTNLAINILGRKEPAGPIERVLVGAMAGVSLSMGVIATQAPSAMSLYWFTSGAFSVGQNIAFKLPVVRKMFGIRWTPSEERTILHKLLFAGRLNK